MKFVRIVILSALFSVVVVAGAPVAEAQSAAVRELQERIAELKEQIADLTDTQVDVSVVFTRTLSLGSTGPEVRALQEVLNNEPGIQVGLPGAPGGPGSETDYFGPKTRKAVNAFQNKYRSEILAPLGYSRPTGVVGPMSRVVLNRVTGGSAAGQGENSSTEGQDEGSSAYDTIDLSTMTTENGFYIRTQSRRSASPGDTLKITGAGFTDETRVVIGRTLLPREQVTVTSAESLKVTVPEGVPMGFNDLILVKGGVYSDPKSSIVVTELGSDQPEITSISQTEESILIKGEQFTDDNIVHTSWRRIFHLDGSTGTITLPKEELRDIFGIGEKETMHFYIINEHGISDAVEHTVTDLL